MIKNIFFMTLFLITLLSCQPQEEVVYDTDDVSTESMDNPPQPSSSHQLAIPEILRSGIKPRSHIPYVSEPTVSYCESVGNGREGYYGIDDSVKRPLASVSKIFLSAFALNRMGADYQFIHHWRLKPINPELGIYDAYFKSNYDPIVNYEKMLYAMTLLKQNGVKKIRQLTIDETTRVYLNVLKKASAELNQVPVSSEESAQNLNLVMNSKNWGDGMAEARSRLDSFMQNKNISMNLASLFSVEQVAFKKAQDINMNQYTKSIKYKSSSLVSYLKEMNVDSNNYIADALFYVLGGYTEFKKFQAHQLGLSSQDLNMLTGSGLGFKMMGERSDNMGSCYAVLKALRYTDLLFQKLNLNLGSLFLVAGKDQGTFDMDADFKQSLVVKTGRLYETTALNSAGLFSNANGFKIYFAYLSSDFDNDNESKYKNYRNSFISSLISAYSSASNFYTTKRNKIFID